MKHPIAFSVLMILLSASSLAFAEKIYKWVDNDGTVHYGSQPGGNQAHEMKIHTPPPSASAPTPATTAQPADKPQPSFMEQYEKDQQDKAEADAKAGKEKEMRDKNCAKARKNMASYEQGGRIYEMDDKGERKFLSDDELASRLQQAKEDVAKWCD